MKPLSSDLRHAYRTFLKRPGFTLMVVLILALGIGGTTAVFSVVNGVLIRPMSFPDADRLVVMWESDNVRDQPLVEVSFPDFRDWQEQNTTFDTLGAMPSTNQEYALTGWGEPIQVPGRAVSQEFFHVLGVEPSQGRTFAPAEDQPGASGVVVLSYGLWQRQFGADPFLVGESIILNGDPHAVVGIMPPEFRYPKGAELWTPLSPAVAQYVENRSVHFLFVLGRLNPGVSVAEAQTEVDVIVHRLTETYGGLSEDVSAVVTPLEEQIFGTTRPALLTLLMAIGLVLLIACANVAGLLLVRGVSRQRELAIRLAMGARRSRIVNQLLSESLLLALLGGLGGILFALWGMDVLVAMTPQDIPRLDEVSVDGRVMGFAMVTSLMAALVCGAMPAFIVSKPDLNEVLKEGRRAVAGGENRRFGRLLVVGEVALAFLLLIGAGLVGKSFMQLSRVELGFRPEGILTFEVLLPEGKYPTPQKQREFYGSLVERIRSFPGVESAAGVLLRPLWGPIGMDWPSWVEGQSMEEAARNPLVNLEAVTPDYFRTMGISLLEGRDFTSMDSEGALGVVVVSQNMAERFWSDENPIGKRLKLRLPGSEYDDQWLEVVGVVSDARYRELEATRWDVYLSYLQCPYSVRHLVVRNSSDPLDQVPAIRREVHALDPDLPVSDVASMQDLVYASMGGARFRMRLLSVFAFAALFLAAVGLYGLMAYTVSQSTHEIGIRLALGARPVDIVGAVVRSGSILTAAGMAIGLGISMAATRSLSRLLFDVSPIDTGTYVIVSIVLFVAALSASLVPALRAARVAPLEALRYE